MFENADNQFIRDWLEYTGGSESPELFNLWSGISALSAVMGRRYIYREGRLEHWPNFYIVIVGPAAVRKSSAGKLAQKLIHRYSKHTRFGPTDTAGRKQGLLASYVRGWGDEEQDEETDGEAEAKSEAAQIANLLNTNPASSRAKSPMLGFSFSPSPSQPKPVESEAPAEISEVNAPAQASNPFAKAAQAAKAAAEAKAADEETLANTRRNPRELFIFADELTTFIGLNQIDMTNCLTHLYYPADNYAYTLAKSEKRIPYPCLSILGCTTPVALASHLPPAAIGQGLTSRCIFVYESQPGPPVFPPPALNKSLAARIGQLFARVNSTPFDEFDAEKDLIEIDRDDAAFKRLVDLYVNHRVDLGDSRFSHYEQRRQEHLCKLAMVLAVGDNRRTIKLKDVNLANEILLHTEVNMPLALGDIGMDKTSQAKQELRDYLTNSWPMGVTIKSFERNARRNMSAVEFRNFIGNLLNNKLATLDNRTIEGQKIEVLVPAMPQEVKAKRASKLSTRRSQHEQTGPARQPTRAQPVELNPFGKAKAANSVN